MKKSSLLNDYLARYAVGNPWELRTGRLDKIDRVVVIPAFAEKALLFATLASLAANNATDLENSLVICVINNKASASAGEKEDNAQTLAILNALIRRQPAEKLSDVGLLRAWFEEIADRPLRLGYIDASSTGLEIPARVGGVGMARKIGMDMALRILANPGDHSRLILSLDADTLVQSNYLSAIRSFYSSGKAKTCTVAYQHQIPPDDAGQKAICSYEIFLRYWVLGLHYARSPYAFQAIGSTIVTTADQYLAVRGMNRREAGEDFYFLNKLAKTAKIQHITETLVYPSARISRRVPFGTGAAVEKIVSGGGSAYRLYNPRVFIILKEWIVLMEESFHLSEKQIMARAQEIDPGLASFLTGRGFLSVWPKMRRNCKDRKTYATQLHNWFDGFETLKLVNYLTKEFYPQIDFFPAVTKILELKDREHPGGGAFRGNSPETEDHMKLLSYLRNLAASW